MVLVDPNITKVPHQEAYTIEDPERRSSSPKSPRLPPIIDEGDVTHGHQDINVAEGQAVGPNIVEGEMRVEKRPQDII